MGKWGGYWGVSLLSPCIELSTTCSLFLSNPAPHPSHPHLQGRYYQSLLTDTDSQLREVK